MARSSSTAPDRLFRHDPTGVERYDGQWTGHRTQHHAHPEYQLTLTRSGCGWFRYLGRSARLPSGCLAVFHPGEPHVLDTVADQGLWRFRVLHIPPRWLEAEGVPLVQPAPLVAEPVLLPVFEAVWFALESGTGIEAALGALAKALRQQPGLEPDHQPRSQLVRRCLDHLAAVTDRPVPISELADLVGATPTQVRRAVVAATGLPPHAWQVQRRILEAKYLLAAGHGIAATAAATGFTDQAHLTRHFAGVVGVTPARYVEGVQAGAGVQ